LLAATLTLFSLTACGNGETEVTDADVDSSSASALGRSADALTTTVISTRYSLLLTQKSETTGAQETLTGLWYEGPNGSIRYELGTNTYLIKKDPSTGGQQFIVLDPANKRAIVSPVALPPPGSSVEIPSETKTATVPSKYFGTQLCSGTRFQNQVVSDPVLGTYTGTTTRYSCTAPDGSEYTAESNFADTMGDSQRISRTQRSTVSVPATLFEVPTDFARTISPGAVQLTAAHCAVSMSAGNSVTEFNSGYRCPYGLTTYDAELARQSHSSCRSAYEEIRADCGNDSDCQVVAYVAYLVCLHASFHLLDLPSL